MEIKKIKKLVSIPLSNDDLNMYFDDTDNIIVKYSELVNYGSIDELLPTDKSFKILLIETKLNSGHWVCIMRYNNTIEVFNSYGCKPSRADFCYVPKLTNLLLGQTEPFLNNLLNKAYNEKQYKIVYNKTKFQKLGSGINTCGRWCTLRIICMKDFDMDLNAFISFIDESKQKTKLNSDLLVSYLIQ
jgi:hypothetical protein